MVYSVTLSYQWIKVIMIETTSQNTKKEHLLKQSLLGFPLMTEGSDNDKKEINNKSC